VSDILDSTTAGPAAVRGGVVRVAAYVAGVAATVVCTALLFRHLGVDDTGRYVTVLSLVTLVAGLTDAGIVALGVREIAQRDGEARRAFLRDLLGLRLVLSGFGLLLALALALVAGYDRTMVLGVLLLGAAVILQSVQGTLATTLQAALRFGWQSGLELLRQLGTVLVTVVLVLLGADLLGFFAVQIPVGLLVLAVTVVVVRGQASLRASMAPARWARLLRDAALFAVATAIFAVYFKIAILLLGSVASEREVGLFAASFRVVDVLLVAPQLAVGAAFPILARAARDDRERLAYGVQRTFEACLLVGAGGGVVLALGAPFAIDVVAGDRFAASAGVLRIQAVAVGASFVAAVWGYTLVSVRADRAFVVLAVVPTLISALATLLLGASHGAEGAAVATVLAELSLVAVGAVAVRRTAGIRLALDRVPRVLLAAAAAAAWGFVPGLPAVAAAALAGVTYLAVALVAGAVPAEITGALRRRGAPARP
jgi:O-antigen/teichoic acid export membrane protein